MKPEYTGNIEGSTYVVTPADLRTIYSIPTASNSPGAAGSGVTVGVIGDSQINLNLVTTYQTITGGTAIAPVEIVDGNDPAITPTTSANDATIAYEQLELISAAAPAAGLNYYVSATTDYDTGLDFAMIRAVDDNAVSILTIGFQSCEATLGVSGNEFINDLWIQAAAQGITVVAAAGDSGSAGCDTPGAPTASSGLGVNGYASTPWNTAVGGTDFYYGSKTGGPNYWSTSNSSTYGSADGYIPEQAWNDSLQNANNSNPGSKVAYAGGGGYSTVGNVAADGVTTSPYPVQSWQISSLPLGSTARAIPDLSFFAGNNYNSAQYAICAQPGDCLTFGTTAQLTFTSGTAAAAAVFAGIMAEVVEKYGLQGNANPTLYALKNTSGVFNDVTVGSNTVACTAGSTNCTNGYMQTAGVNDYATATGYDLATGLGSVNATKLINNWGNAAATKPSTTTMALTNFTTGAAISGSIVHGTPLNFTANVTGSGGIPTGSVAFETGSTLPGYGGIIASQLTAGSTTASYNYFLPGGSYNVTARYAGDTNFLPSTASTPITITPESSRILMYSSFTGTPSSPVTLSSGKTVPFGTFVNLTIEPFSLTNNNVSTPTGTISVYSNGNDYPYLLLPLSTEGTATYSTNLLSGGTYSLVFEYSGDPSYAPSTTSSSPFSVTVQSAPSVTTLATTSSTVYSSVPVTLTATVQATTGSLAQATGVAPTGYVIISGAGQSSANVELTSGFNQSGHAVGIATYQVSTSTVPTNGTLSVVYNGDSNYASSSSSITLSTGTHTGSTSTVSLSENAYPVAANGTLSFTIKTTTPSGTTAAGTVAIYANSVLVGTTTVTTTTNSGSTTYTVPLTNGYLPCPSGTVIFTAIFTPSSGAVAPSSTTATEFINDDRTTADFGISTDTLTQTITPSSSSVYFQVQLTSIANFESLNDSIALTCSVPGNSNLKCSLGTTSTTIGSTGVAITTLQITGYPTVTNGALKSSPQGGRWWLIGGGSTLAFVFMLGIPARRKGWRAGIASLSCLIIIATSLSGCGSNMLTTKAAQQTTQSGFNSSGATANTSYGIATNAVAPGTYHVTITGTATTNTTLTHNTQVTVIVSTIPALANGTYTIGNLSSQSYLTDPAASTKSGGQLELFTADGTTDQKWVFTYQNNGYYTIQNAGNNLYLTDPGGADSQSPVTVSTQATATGDNTQLWTFDLLEGGYQIISAASGGVMDDDGFGDGNGTPAIVYPQKPANQGVNQTWYIQ
jgi:hypothetical protein